ncbi:alpha-mannosidase [Kaistia sp. 32K]|uniref:glycoside hydrolase family 38 N-terminal domain-containing protein n=1 Tax=Kaistia sp. 32K TaxID=2795690 RepID=UPI001915B7CB|nr:hypothetical protein [Kaistia sp. 32K]BCP55189.1 alpha-mannosidase [Kaistia sp. 32K]
MKLKEILVLHHSHLDVGYTHSQPIIWELQREYIDQALDLLDETADWPAHLQPKWTCEVTSPVLKWLETASAADEARFRRMVEAGRLAIGAMRYNVTALNGADQLARQLAPVAELRERFGARINTALQHDVTGVPWPLADLLLDHGVDLLVMAVNRHLGNHVEPRPGIFRWRTPSGRELRVMNGNHYTMFDQVLLSWERSLDSMASGLSDYVGHLDRIGYPHDFLYLTTTAAPEMWDNAPPNPAVAELIRRWNEEGREPAIRYVTTEDLAERIKAIPDDQLPLLDGDWTDYWNFGCASTATLVRRSRAAKRALDAADQLAGDSRSGAVTRAADRARDLLDLFDEHTWTYWDTAAQDDNGVIQDALKAAPAVEAGELAKYVLTHELEATARNPAHSESAPDHVVLFNPSPVARREYVEIPTAWRKPGPRLRTERFKPDVPGEADVCGPFEVPAHGVVRLPLADLAAAEDDLRVFHEDRRSPASFRAFNNVRLEIARTGHAVIESPTHRLSYDPDTGRILGLYDKQLDWDVCPANGDYDFFDFVRERPDALVDGRREAYYDRDLDREKIDQSCWKPWRAIRERATRLRSCVVTRTPGSVTLERLFDAPGTSGLKQRITLRADTSVVTVECDVDKLAYADPEAIYFALPLNLDAGWRSHFDTAGLPVALDEQQLPGACRNWFTADTFASIHTVDRGASLFLPDAPLAMAGGFHFGPPLDAVPRDADPLLLAWPMNNYWNTNYPLTQPGLHRFRYGLLTHAAFDPDHIRAEAAAFANPILVYPGHS